MSDLILCRTEYPFYLLTRISLSSQNKKPLQATILTIFCGPCFQCHFSLWGTVWVSSAYALQLGVDGLLVQFFESSIFYWDQNYACAAQRWAQDFIHNFVGSAFPKQPLLCNLYGTFCFFTSLFHYSSQKDESVVPPLLCFSVTSFAFGTKQEEGREEKHYWGSPHPVGATVHWSERKISFPQNFGSSGLLLTGLAPQDDWGQGTQEN